MKNRYCKRAKVSEYKFRQLLSYFAQDLTATQLAAISGLNINTVDRYLRAIRKRIALVCAQESPFKGEVEVDESYFGARRLKGKRGRGAYGKTIVFGIFKRQGKVYTEIVADCSSLTLQKAIRGKVSLESIIHSDNWRGYNGLVDVGYAKHLRVDHGRNEFANKKSHINGIESFWAYAKTRLVRFRGLHKHTFLLHLKETEFRFNYRNKNLYAIFLNLLKSNPLF